jgi:hypothetical protein
MRMVSFDVLFRLVLEGGRTGSRNLLTSSGGVGKVCYLCEHQKVAVGAASL